MDKNRLFIQSYKISVIKTTGNYNDGIPQVANGESAISVAGMEYRF